MNSVVIFDISDPTYVKNIRERMRGLGYHNTWSVTDDNGIKKSYYLPHNMVWKVNTESSQAFNDLQQVINQLNQQQLTEVKLQRCIILNSSPWGGIEGEPVI